MPRIWKEVLLPNCRQRDARGRWFEFSTHDVQQAHRNVKKMLERGVPVPLVFEHVDLEAGDPEEWRANYAKHCFGHVGDSRINDRGALELRHDIANPEDVKRLRANKFVSPKVRPQGWWDSKGGEYDGTTVTHVALTPSPVQFWQRPFELSDKDAIYFAYSPEPPAEKKSPSAPIRELCPAHNRRRDGRALSTTNPEAHMADEKDDEKEYEGDGEGGGKNADLDAICEALRKKGMNIPDAVEDWKHLLIAIEANGASAEPDGDENPDDDMDATGTASGADTTAPAGGAPMMMSTVDADPVRRKRARTTVKPEREEAIARVNAALGARKLNGPTARKLIRVFGSVALSVTADGDVVDADAKSPRFRNAMKTLEAAEQGKPLEAVELSATVHGGDAPAALRGDESEGLKAVLAKQEELARRQSNVTK